MSLVKPSSRTPDETKRLGSVLSLATNLLLTIFKVIAAVMTGSVSLFSESIHSTTDVIASLITYLSVRVAAVPPDEEHPYGHGKVESLASFAESILLILIVLFIFKESVDRLMHGSHVRSIVLGFWIMGGSALISLFVGLFVSKVGAETESAALRSNGRHLMIDFWTSVGVFTALCVTKFTGWEQADAWFAMGLALWIAYNAISISREAIEQLIDRRVSDDEIKRIHNVLKNVPDVISYHRLRTRHSGNVHYIDVDVVVPNHWTVVQGHALADEIESQLQFQAMQRLFVTRRSSIQF